jgi:hypothetical protein
MKVHQRTACGGETLEPNHRLQLNLTIGLAMNCLRIVGGVILAVRLALAVPCVIWGLATLVGLAPHGSVPIWARIIAFCVLCGGVGLGFPFRWFDTTEATKWMFVALSALPFCCMLLGFIVDRRGLRDMPNVVGASILLLGAILTLADLLLSRIYATHRSQSDVPPADGEDQRR